MVIKCVRVLYSRKDSLRKKSKGAVSWFVTGECECDILKGVTSTARSPFFKGQGSHPTCHFLLSFGKQFVRVLAEMNVLIFSNYGFAKWNTQ